MSAATTALFFRGLRLDARAIAPYLIRPGLLLIVAFWLFSAAQGPRGMGAPGLMFFGGVSFITCVFMSGAAAAIFASAITEEKEEYTLGLLKLTGLSPLSILLGKGASRMVSAVLLLLLQLPFTLLAVTLGGVSLNQVFAVHLTLLSYLVFLGGLALFCSVVSRHSFEATAITIGALLIFFLVPPLGRWLIGEWRSARSGYEGETLSAFLDALLWTLNWTVAACPFVRLAEIFQSGFAGPVVGYQVISNLVLGGGFFLLSWAVFEVCTREHHEPAQVRGPVARTGSRLRFFAAGRAWGQAFVWKDFHFMRGGRVGLIARSLLLVALCAVYWYLAATEFGSPYRRSFDEYSTGLGAAIFFTVGGVLYLELLLAAGRMFSDEAKWQTLGSIVALPSPLATLAWGKVLAVFISAIPYAVCLFFGAALFLPDRDVWKFVASSNIIFVAYNFLQLVLLLYLVAWFSLLLKRLPFIAALTVWGIGNSWAAGGAGMLAAMVAASGPWAGSDYAEVLAKALFGGLCAGTVALIWLLHRAVGKQIYRAAGE